MNLNLSESKIHSFKIRSENFKETSNLLIHQFENKLADLNSNCSIGIINSYSELENLTSSSEILYRKKESEIKKYLSQVKKNFIRIYNLKINSNFFLLRLTAIDF